MDNFLSTIGNGLSYLDPGKGNSNLASSLSGIAKQAGTQATQGRDFEMGGLRGAQQFYQPAAQQYSQLFGQGGSLAGPGSLEKFAAQDLTHSNPYQDMLTQQGMSNLDQQYNATGMGNSGARMAALGKFQAQQNADQYANEANLQGQAQQAGLARGQLGLSGGTALGAAQAGTQQGFYTDAQKNYNDLIGAMLAAQTNAAGAQKGAVGDRQSGIMGLLGLGGGGGGGGMAGLLPLAGLL